MSRRTIQSPGVEIREIDQTLRAPANVGTTVFIPGFSNEGPTDEILNVGTFSDFENIYGKPTNAAERYFYHSVRQVFNSDANVYVSRLPYGESETATTKYTAQVYPVITPNALEISAFGTDGKSITFAAALTDLVSSVTDPVLPNFGEGGATQLSARNATFAIEAIFKDDKGNISHITTTHSFSGQQTAGSSASETTIASTSATVLTASEVNNTILEYAKDKYTLIKALAYTNGAKKGDTGFTGFDEISGVTANLSGADYYVLGQPTLVELTKAQYEQLNSEDLTWSNTSNNYNNTFSATGDDTSITSLTGTLSAVGMIVLNTGKTSVNEKYEGHYATIIDNTELNPATDFDSVHNQYSIDGLSTDYKPGSYTAVPSTRLDYALSASNTSEIRNVSRSLEDIPTFNINGPEFVDTIAFGLIKSRITPAASDDLKISYFLAEGYTGSLNYYRTIQNEKGSGNKSFFIEAADEKSPNVKILANPYITKHDGDWTSGVTEAPTKFVRVAKRNSNASIVDTAVAAGGVANVTNFNTTPGIYGFGSFVDTGDIKENKGIGSVPNKLQRVFDIASNVELFNIDVSIEAGLGTIFVNSRSGSDTTLTAASAFEDTAFLNLGSTSGTSNQGFYTTNTNMTDATQVTIRDNYRAVYNQFEQFARQTRKDHIFIADILRNIVVQGENNKILDNKENNFSKHVYWPLRHQFGVANSNYACVYANWAKVYDFTSDKQMWIPFSGVAASNFARTDANFAPWFAPAGFTRGVVTNVNDIAISPTQRQRDQLYRVALNPVTQFPNEGIVIFGQKTLQKKPTAFDRVNVRRLFLDLEKRTKRTMKYFIFEPNTFLTRTKVVNTLTPIFENAKQTEGVYDYLIVCDERNNTTDRINNNELVVDIYLKPVRAAEFILVNFYAVNNDVNFEEIVGQ